MMKFDNLESKFAQEPQNPWPRMDEEVVMEDIFSANHVDQSPKTISMSNDVAPPLSPECDAWGFLDLEQKDKGLAATQIAPNRRLRNDDIGIQHSSPYREDCTPKDGIMDGAVEAEDSIQQDLKIDASPCLTPEQENTKEIKGMKGMGKTKKITKTKGKPTLKAAQKRLNDMQDESAEEGSNSAPKAHKKDQRKNMYGYSLKHVVREYFSDKYKKALARHCKMHKISEQQMTAFYKPKLNWSISLSNVLTLLNYKAFPADSAEHRTIKAFHSFYVCYMRTRYTIHILTSREIEHKEQYLQAKRILIYLPRIRKDKLNNLLVNCNEQ